MIPDSLRRFFEENPRPGLAFSGGSDSTYLLYVCHILEVDVVPYFVRGSFQTPEEEETVRASCTRYGFEPRILNVNVFDSPGIVSNGPDRCYLCKRFVFSRIIEAAKRDGRAYVMDGTNASDDPAGRPGMRALEEMGIISPLRICGITKADVRRLSKEAGIPGWDRPSDSCLATRTPTGTSITEDGLRRTYEAEKAVREFGFRGFRVRTRGTGARLEIDPSQRSILEEYMEEIEAVLLKYYDSVSYGERTPS